MPCYAGPVRQPDRQLRGTPRLGAGGTAVVYRAVKQPLGREVAHKALNIAPEQVLGQDLDHRVDIYAMGVMTFETMTGQMPFGGASAVEIVIATVNQPVSSACAINPALPDELDAVLVEALAKEPRDRPASARALIGMLGKVPQRRSRVTPAVAAPPPPPVATLPPARAPQSAVAVAGVARPAVNTLERMGLPRLQPTSTTCAPWYFESVMHSAREVAGPAWLRIAQSTDLGSPKAVEEANDRLVDEIECGCVTGSDDCVFAIRSIRA